MKSLVRNSDLSYLACNAFTDILEMRTIVLAFENTEILYYETPIKCYSVFWSVAKVYSVAFISQISENKGIVIHLKIHNVVYQLICTSVHRKIDLLYGLLYIKGQSVIDHSPGSIQFVRVLDLGCYLS